MIEIALTSVLHTLILCITLGVAGFVMLRLYDRICGISFKDWWFDADSSDRALYLSVRFVAVFGSFAWVIGN